MSNELAHVASAITNKLDRLDENHRRVALDAFAELKRLDAETSKLAMKIFGNREDTALWLAAKIPSLGGKRPWQCLAEGKREDVHRILDSIRYGIIQ